MLTLCQIASILTYIAFAVSSHHLFTLLIRPSEEKENKINGRKKGGGEERKMKGSKDKDRKGRGKKETSKKITCSMILNPESYCKSIAPPCRFEDSGRGPPLNQH